MPKKGPAYDVFISYSTKNKTVADALCKFLEEKKIRCWMAPRNILAGQNYAEAIAQALTKVKIFVLVYSNYSLASQWVQSETNMAVTRRKIIIPFRIKDCSFEETAMEVYLTDRHWIDAFPDPEKSFDKLADAITSSLPSRRGKNLPVKSKTGLPKKRSLSKKSKEKTDQCPYCSEKVSVSTRKCPRCGMDILRCPNCGARGSMKYYHGLEDDCVSKTAKCIVR